MTREDFIKKIENYYGKYRPAVKAEVSQYLSAIMKIPGHYDDLYKQLILTETNRFGIPPDIALMEKAIKNQVYSQHPIYKYFRPALPEPETRDYSRELGEWFRKLVKAKKVKA